MCYFVCFSVFQNTIITYLCDREVICQGFSFHTDNFAWTIDWLTAGVLTLICWWRDRRCWRRSCACAVDVAACLELISHPRCPGFCLNMSECRFTPYECTWRGVIHGRHVDDRLTGERVRTVIKDGLFAVGLILILNVRLLRSRILVDSVWSILRPRWKSVRLCWRLGSSIYCPDSCWSRGSS